jgi:hypothetical protein
MHKKRTNIFYIYELYEAHYAALRTPSTSPAE